jgi:hypothetical protein
MTREKTGFMGRFCFATKGTNVEMRSARTCEIIVLAYGTAGRHIPRACLLLANSSLPKDTL